MVFEFLVYSRALGLGPAGRHAIKSRNLFGVQVAIILWPAEAPWLAGRPKAIQLLLSTSLFYFNVAHTTKLTNKQ